MAKAATKLPVIHDTRKPTPPGAAGREPMATLRKEIDRLFEGFPSLPSAFRRSPFEVEPFWRREWSVGAVPSVDIVEKEGAYEVTAELPGVDEKNIEVSVADGMLTIKGEKEEAREEKKKDYHLSERYYGSIRRTFGIPGGIDPARVVASFRNGVLTVTLPKSAEAKSKERKIAITSK